MNEGVTCKKCGCQKHYWLSSKWQYQCSKCNFRTTLRSGRVMENSRLPFRVWFLVMLFMMSTKKGVSACELQRQIGHKRYTTIWGIMHRLRIIMGKRDALYQLTDMIEFDEGYFEKSVPEKIRKKLKRGRGSLSQTNILVIAESAPLEDIGTGEVSRHCRYFEMKALKTQKAKEINEVLAKSIDLDSVIFTDRSTRYFDMVDFVDAHIAEKSLRKTTTETLQWVLIAISNAKRNLLGIYHKISGEYLQNYLDEFVYKLNRRYLYSVLDRLMMASVYPYWHTTE